MIFKRIYLFLLLILLPINIVAKNISVGFVCENSIKCENLKKLVGNEYKISDINHADILICDTIDGVKKCLKYNKKIIAIDIYSYQIPLIQSPKIIGYFPVDVPLSFMINYITKKLGKNLKKCVLSHYKYYSTEKGYDFYYVKNINDVPFVLNKALKKCDIIISVPDKVVYNYFSTRFIFKRVILGGKLITGFSKDMIDLGAVYSFEINRKKYFKRILNFLNEISEYSKFSKVFCPDKGEINSYENEKIIKCIK